MFANVQVYQRNLLSSEELQVALEAFDTHKLYCHTGKMSEKDTPNDFFLKKKAHWANLEIAKQVISYKLLLFSAGKSSVDAAIKILPL